ncbi:MAG: thermonuclease family protein [Hyphomonadaceae bacterium]|nr:thermonuclease family protein [Hyphomonadaceae bacterium]
MRRTKQALAAFSIAIATLAFALASHAVDRPVPNPSSDPSRYFAIDGDTLQHRQSGRRYRIANIDTPEVGRSAACAAERRLGERATRRVRDLLTRAETLQLRRAGGDDDYGRAVVRVLIDGRDLGGILIADGLARSWRGYRAPWCDASGRLIL